MNGIVILVMLVGATISAIIAANKNRSALGWAVVGAMFPLISALIVANVAALPSPSEVMRPPSV